MTPQPPQITLAGDWRIAVSVETKNGPLRAVLDVAPPDVATVAAEKYEPLPLLKSGAGDWCKGAALAGLRAAECTVKDALLADSLVVRDGETPAAAVFEKGRDYDAELHWANVWRLPGGRIQPTQAVFIGYRCVKMRLDSVVLAPDGKITLRRGEPHVAQPLPPQPAADEIRLANVFISGPLARLSPEHLYPITETAFPEPPRPTPSVAETLLPKTMQKIRDGRPLKILAWGDSVTAMNHWQRLFVEWLRERFPKAHIELLTEAWGGRNTGSYLAEPPGGAHNYQEKVLARKPDLIISEFVNDAGLNPAQVAERYGRFADDFQKIGAEWIILTPHYVRPDWMGLRGQKEIDEDPRPYVAGLRRFTAERRIALADASRRYGRLWRQGLPYLTLMENNINHPDQRGHRIFADSLTALFP